jgi:hypothetical protein
MKRFLAKYWSVIVFAAIAAAAIGVRVYNLNYNSAFNDEAIYVVIGRMGAFQGDWWTYNAAAWMAGQPYFYPTLTGMAYMLNGLVGSRLLNVAFGVLEVEALCLLTMLLVQHRPRKEQVVAGLIAAAAIGGSAVGMYVSRLATYDMLSFYLLFLSLVMLLIAQKPNMNHGKWYFLAAVFLFMSFSTKIVVAAYIPLIFAYSWYMARRLGPEVMRFWKIYFMSPLLLCMGAYIVFNWNSLLTYVHSQSGRDFSSYGKLLHTYWENSRWEWALWAVASIGLLFRKQWKMWAIWTGLSTIILASHLYTHRYPTLDKHTFLSITFLFPLIGIGLTNLIYASKLKVWRAGVTAVVVTALGCYWINAYSMLPSYNNQWHNADTMLGYLHDNTHTGDKVLAEVGAAAILANYDHNFPPNTTTFDYFEYKHAQGEKAYLAAIRDGYFSMIELDGGDSTSEQAHSTMHNLVLTNIGSNYKVAYKSQDFVIFKREF